MLANISILIINSSHKSIDIITSILKTKIRSKQRPNIACLSYEEFKDESNLKSFIEAFVSKKMTECREIVENARRMKEFNQLEMWKNEVNKRRISSRMKNEAKNKLCMLKNEDINVLEAILDSPNENDFYLILFDVYDCEFVKSIASFERSSLVGLVNLYPRHEIDSYEGMLNQESFWKKLLRMKYNKHFENVAFIDMDVPVESSSILNLRSQIIYDQFCHFFYDFQESKSSYKKYYEHLEIHDVNCQQQDNDNDFKQFQKRLNEIPSVMLSIEDIYEAIIEQIAKDDINTIVGINSDFMLNENSMRKFMEIEAYGKRFYDINDTWRKGYAENPNFYTQKIHKLEESCSDIWNNIDTQQSIEHKQILFYFMNKIIAHLTCNGKGKVF